MPQYRVPVLEDFSFQQPIKDKDLSEPPVSPVKGDRYIVGGSATGDWETHEKDIATYTGTGWMFDTPESGWLTYILDENEYYYFSGTAWETLTSITGAGDMLKAVYDTNNNSIVDKAEQIDDGAGITLTASQLKEAYDKRAIYDADYKALIFNL